MNTKIIQDWITKHEPQGMSKLSAATELSVATFVKILREGRMPNLNSAKKIAAVIGVTLDELAEDSPAA